MDKYVMNIRLKQWIPILEAQARSGLDKQTFCKQNGISRGLFFKWQRILRERIADGFDPGVFQLQLPLLYLVSILRMVILFF